MEFMDGDEGLFLTRNCFSQEVSEPNFSMGKDRQIHWKLQETVEWLLLLTMKNLKRGRHLEYRKYTNNTHIVGSPCLVWMGEERNDLIQIIGDSETIPQVNPEILNITDKDELLNYWLSKFEV